MATASTMLVTLHCGYLAAPISAYMLGERLQQESHLWQDLMICWDWEVVCALSNGTFLMTLDDCLTAETAFGF